MTSPVKRTWLSSSSLDIVSVFPQLFMNIERIDTCQLVNRHKHDLQKKGSKLSCLPSVKVTYSTLPLFCLFFPFRFYNKEARPPVFLQTKFLVGIRFTLYKEISPLNRNRWKCRQKYHQKLLLPVFLNSCLADLE